MTDEEIMALSDRELNECVALAAGWTRRKVTPEECHRITSDTCATELWIDGQGRWRYRPPNYTGDIAAAWPLVEEAKLVVSPEYGRWCCFKADVMGYREGMDYVGVLTYRKGGAARAWGDSAPEAICRAYLLVKGVSE